MSKFITIPGFESLTKQQMFDMAANHIGTTKQASRRVTAGGQNGGCVYSGTGCNAAPFILPEYRLLADEKYGSWRAVVHSGAAPDHECGFVHDLQQAHDGPLPRKEFRPQYLQNMRTLGESHKLDMSVLDKVEANWPE